MRAPRDRGASTAAPWTQEPPLAEAADELTDYFERYGWKYERRRGDLYRTGFVGEGGQFEIWVRYADPWVYFTINPFVEKRELEQGHGADILALMLRANHEVNMAKFALDKDGDVSLSVELPTENFGYSQFADALTALSHYADEFRPRFRTAVQDDSDAEVV